MKRYNLSMKTEIQRFITAKGQRSHQNAAYGRNGTWQL